MRTLLKIVVVVPILLVLGGVTTSCTDDTMDSLDADRADSTEQQDTSSDAESRFRTRCESSVRSAEQGRTRYDELEAALCIHTLDEHCHTMSNPFDHQPCRGVFTGLVELGDACYPSERRRDMVGAVAYADSHKRFSRSRAELPE